MRRVSTLLGFILFAYANAQVPDTAKTLVVGDDNEQEVKQLVVMPDSTIWLIGTNVAFYKDGYVVIVDSEFNVLLEQSYILSFRDDEFLTAKAISDTVIIIGGYKTDSASSRDFYVAHIGRSGSVLWEWTWGTTDIDVLNDLVIKGVNFIAVGTSWGGDSGMTDIVVLEAEYPMGGLKWIKQYGGSNLDEGKKVIATASGSLLIAGNTTSQGNGAMDILLMKLDSDGNLIWQTTFGYESYDLFSDMTVLPDGRIALSGHTTSKGNGAFDLWLLLLDSMGIVLMDTTYGGILADVPHSMIYDPLDSAILIVGYTESFSYGTRELWLLKVNLQGKVLWQFVMGCIPREEGQDIVQIGKGRYLVAGYTESWGNARKNAWLLEIVEKYPESPDSGNTTYSLMPKQNPYSLRINKPYIEIDYQSDQPANALIYTYGGKLLTNKNLRNGKNVILIPENQPLILEIKTSNHSQTFKIPAIW
ncbi:MAG: hypothetical protein GXO48_05140 [Chlorobi bacterium]|nr:hypothetical protein [Chlorobiota bacterium]